MTHDQEQLIIELLESDMKKHSVKAVHPMVQTWADGRVEDIKETLEEFRKILSQNEEVAGEAPPTDLLKGGAK